MDKPLDLHMVLMRESQVTRLSIDLVKQRLLRENEEVKASYSTMKAPDKKMREIKAPKDLSNKKTTIPQIEVPKGSGASTKKASTKGGGMGIPQAERGDKAVGNMKVPSFSKSTAAKSPPTPVVKKLGKPNQDSKLNVVKNPIKKTESGSGSKANTIPSADFADTYTRKMPHGSTTLGSKGSKKVPEVSAKAEKTLKGTTKPSSKEVKLKTPGNHTVQQVSHTAGMMKSPSDAPAKPSWVTAKNGENVLESVQIYINGKPKASFGIINKDVATKMVENYQSFGYNVELKKTNKSGWKSDREFLSLVFEAMDARYNNAPETSNKLQKAAMNRFFHLSQIDYNNMYESRQQFTHTVKSAFDSIMERADIKYRQKLDVVEGLVRIELGEDVIDLDMITQARDINMALRNMRNEIIEEYGFKTKIKHVFIDGTKYGPQHIHEWNGSRK